MNTDFEMGMVIGMALADGQASPSPSNSVFDRIKALPLLATLAIGDEWHINIHNPWQKDNDICLECRKDFGLDKDAEGNYKRYFAGETTLFLMPYTISYKGVVQWAEATEWLYLYRVEYYPFTDNKRDEEFWDYVEPCTIDTKITYIIPNYHVRISWELPRNYKKIVYSETGESTITESSGSWAYSHYIDFTARSEIMEGIYTNMTTDDFYIRRQEFHDACMKFLPHYI